MSPRGIELTEIKRDLAKLPENKLAEVHDHIRRLIPQKQHEPRIQPLKGIWKGLGWENVTNLEEEIRTLRDESAKRILDRFD